VPIKGRVWKYGDNINTDVIFPGKYTYTIDKPEEIAAHAFEDIDPHFAREVRTGDIIVAGQNFGCGSSREQAVLCLKYAGIGVIIAKSFARIYYRNAINNGVLVVTHSSIQDAVKSGEEISIDIDEGTILTTRNQFSFPPPPDFIQEILDSGGLIPYTQKRLEI